MYIYLLNYHTAVVALFLYILYADFSHSNLHNIVLMKPEIPPRPLQVVHLILKTNPTNCTLRSLQFLDPTIDSLALFSAI